MSRRARSLGAAVALLLATALLGACNRQPSVALGPRDGGALTSCIDQLTDLPRPPTGKLPCELIPPGLELR